MKGNRKSLIRSLLQIREERKKAFLLHLLISWPRGAASNSFGVHRGGCPQIALKAKIKPKKPKIGMPNEFDGSL